MSETRSGPVRIGLAHADDPRDVVHQAVACLGKGGVVALPAESSYLLAAKAIEPTAVARLRAIKGLEPGRPVALGLRGAGEIADWVPDISATGRKFARRAWPGPVTLVVKGDIGRGLAARLPGDVRAWVAPGSTLGLRLPGHDAVREVIDLVPGPLVLSDAPGRSGGRAVSADELEGIAELDMILDDGASPIEARNSVVLLEEDRWSLIRPGAVSSDALQRMTGTILLFVCTGNTCRSPMAEALCRLVLAERLGCKPEDVEARGYVVGSAGLAASHGARAASEAVEIVHARGGNLRSHASRQVSPSLIAAADHIIVMTRDHLEALLDEHPDAEDRARLLHPRGADIADPIGADRETYRRTAEAIEIHLKALLDEILAGDQSS